LEVNIYLKTNGTEWKTLPIGSVWKMKKEPCFSGLDDDQYLQLSGYQQEARHFDYCEKSEHSCLRTAMSTSIMQLLDFQMGF